MSAWHEEPSRARMLAAWTRLRADRFGFVYQRLDAVPGARQWPMLTLEQDPILAACEEAELRGFIVELARTIADEERLGGRRKRDDLEALLLVFSDEATAEAIIDPQRGLPGDEMHDAIGVAMRAATQIRIGDEPAGTGFLVGPDLVLTAGHVVLDVVTGPGGKEVFADTLRPGIRFLFRSTGRAYDQEVAPAPPGKAPVVMASPHATPPNLLDTRLSAKSADALDFALVRLARQVRDVDYLDIAAPPSPRKEALWVVGFAQGSRIVFPDDKVRTFDPASGRIFHGANATPGMSGSCCLGPDGKPVAIHEGSLPLLDEQGRQRREGGKNLVINRAVSLSAIRARLAAARPDPLTQRARAPGLAFLDSATVERWRTEARRLAGASLGAWDKAVQDRIGISPTEPDLPAFHPWFRRKTLETWVNEAGTRLNERVRYINGPPGAGKSFAARIVAETINDASRNLLVLNPTLITNWNWEDALTRLGGTAQGDLFRTQAGALRHETIPEIVDKLGLLAAIPRRPDQPLFIAIDFERDTAGSSRLRFENTPWPSFVVALAGQPWGRLLLIGLSEAERTDFDDMFANDALAEEVSPVDIDLHHVDEEDIIDFLKAAFEAQGQRVRRADLKALTADWKQPAFHHQAKDLQTVEAVLFAMERTRDLWRQPTPDPAGSGR